MSRLRQWLAMKGERPLVLSWYCIVGTVAAPIISNTPHRNEVFTMFVFFWLFHCDPPKIFSVKAKMHALSYCFPPLPDFQDNLSGKGYLSAALTLKILGRECVFTARRNQNLPGRKDSDEHAYYLYQSRRSS